ncbi:MAG: PfkB family carbohydrate kinase [Terracidiphilus sp.]|jgi:sugar/nucleoside kinase (ribokinase family)
MNPPRVLFLGRTTLDATYCIDRLPAEDTKVYASHFHAAPGGPALNAAITHSLLGGKSLLISAVGSGPWSIPVRAALERHRISLLDLAANTAYETPLTTVLVNSASASRTIVNPPIDNEWVPLIPRIWGSGKTQTSDDVSPQQSLPTDWSPLPQVLLTDGFHLAETLPFLAACRNAGSALCLDGGSWKPGTEELAPLLTAAICSERFAVPGQSATSCDALFDWFSSRGVPCIALTRGPRPILCWERGRRFQIEIAQINVADTLGAGDVLHGAFAYFFVSGHDFEPALRRAAQIATLSCQSTGVESWTGHALAAAYDPALKQSHPGTH